MILGATSGSTFGMGGGNGSGGIRLSTTMMQVVRVGRIFLLAFLLVGYIPFVNGNAGVFTYYETPMFDRIGNTGYVMAHSPAVGAGPSQWKNILFPPIVAPLGNQCGGRGQESRYGQSPIVIEGTAVTECQTDLTGYIFDKGTCTWEELEFRIISNGVIVHPKVGSVCRFGRMKIPGKSHWFNALQFHIHTGSEHSVEQPDNNQGKYYPAELHVVHASELGDDFAVFGMFIDHNPNNDTIPHDTFEYYLQGWESVAQNVEEYCAVKPEGTGIWGPTSVFESRQRLLKCPAPGSTIEDPDSIIWDTTTDMPLKHPVDFPTILDEDDRVQVDIPHIYEDLPTPGYGVYSYRGGLTTPPCTEIVNWNLLDTPLYASRTQIERLYHLILCLTEPSTCKHSTIANEIGQTNRPVQPLLDRTVLHRCVDGPAPPSEDRALGVPVPVPPVKKFIHTQERRCILGGNGGPLQQCWIDTVQEHFGLLYPWFVMFLGVVTFYLLTRYAPWFPYTAFLFFLGVCMGVVSVKHDAVDQLSSSIRMWEDIGAEILLMGFLPGLLFRDSYTSKVFLFQRAFWQCWVMAFPMVLAGTVLTALIGYYILPYGWSWAFCMTFGAILSATDPVAVSALLNELGAPPRLKIHISGESLLNDGSAIVFFTIFSQIFEFELGNPGFGTSIDFATGLGLFLRMSTGAVVVGALFAAGLLIMVYLLDRKFNYEESIVQVSASITAAYLCYYTAESVLGMSGVIAVVTLGVITKFYSSSLFHDSVMMEKFWVLLEHILNSILFHLGGMIFGRIVSGHDPEHRLTARIGFQDYGYILLVWALLIVIRFFLMFAFSPIISRLGLGTNWRELVFMSWGGLRGAVGIALAVHLDKHITHQFFRVDPRRRFTTQLFSIVGGVAMLTLCVNGTLSGPILRALGLAKLGEAREAITARYHDLFRRKMFEKLLRLLGQPRFAEVDFRIIKKHISFFDELTTDEIKYAVKSYKETTPVLEYNQPNLSTLKPYMDEANYQEIVDIAKADVRKRLKAIFTMASFVQVKNEINNSAALSAAREGAPGNDGISKGGVPDRLMRTISRMGEEGTSAEDMARMTELRKVFIELLQHAYEDQFDKGEVDVHSVHMVVALKTALEVERTRVSNGGRLGSWEMVTDSISQKGNWLKKKGEKLDVTSPLENDVYAQDIIHAASAFIEAHQRAQRAFKIEFCYGQALSDDELEVLTESEVEVKMAEDSIFMFRLERRNTHMAHLMCTVLLHNAADYVAELNHQGLLLDQETEHYLEEIEHDIHRIEKCKGSCDGSENAKSLLITSPPKSKENGEDDDNDGDKSPSTDNSETIDKKDTNEIEQLMVVVGNDDKKNDGEAEAC